MPQSTGLTKRQTPTPVSFSYEQINLLREVLRELLNSGISRSEIARELGTTPSLVTNFVRLMEPTKRPNHNRFLVPLFKYVVEELQRNSANPRLYTVVNDFIRSVSHILEEERSIYEDIKGIYRIIMRTGNQFTIQYLSISNRCNMDVIGKFAKIDHYEGVLVSNTNPIHIFLTSGNGAASITAEIPIGRIFFWGIGVFSKIDENPIARKLFIERCNEQEELPDPRVLSLSELESEIVPDGINLEYAQEMFLEFRAD